MLQGSVGRLVCDKTLRKFSRWARLYTLPPTGSGHLPLATYMSFQPVRDTLQDTFSYDCRFILPPTYLMRTTSLAIDFFPRHIFSHVLHIGLEITGVAFVDSLA